MSSLIDTAYEEAVKVLEMCLCEKGFKASAYDGDYSQIWSRDFSITFLGMSELDDERFKETAKRSLEALTAAQYELGQIPNNVDAYSDQIESDNAGAIDSNMWYILTHYVYFKAYKDDEPIRKHYENIERVFTWLRYQDSNSCGLLEQHEGADWADALANKYNVLYPNVLYYVTIQAMMKIREVAGKPAGNLEALAQRIKKLINLRFWVNKLDTKQLETLRATRNQWAMEYEQIISVLWRSRYYLPYVAFRDWADRCDAFGNSLAIVTGIADEAKSDAILSHFKNSGMSRPYPIRVLDPPIFEGSKDWREYYRVLNLNLPYGYHNGGIWPFIGGFYVAALVRAGQMETAKEQLEALAQANKLGKKDQWDFNEWLNGLWGTPMGAAKEAWSAGMYIYAYNAVKTGKLEYFDELV